MPRQRGFTLVELMVVITIVAVLATIGIVSYQVVLKNSRDARRQTDLRTIQTGLEQYFADQLFYPKDNGSTCSNGFLAFNTSTQCTLKNSGATKTYINSVPINPTASSTTLQYCYKPLKASQTCTSVAARTDVNCDNTSSNASDRCTSYCLYAKMENPPSTATFYPIATSTESCDSTTATVANPYNYKLTPP